MGHRYDIMRDAALREKGRDWRNLIMWLEAIRIGGPWVAGAAVLGALGWAVHRLWTWVAAPHAHDATLGVAAAHVFGAVPVWLWVAAGMVAALLVWLFRPGRIVTPSQSRMRVVGVCAIVIVFAGLFGLGLSVATT
jgi:hypothetical protein